MRREDSYLASSYDKSVRLCVGGTYTISRNLWGYAALYFIVFVINRHMPGFTFMNHSMNIVPSNLPPCCHYTYMSDIGE
jgi:hypothetical protein